MANEWTRRQVALGLAGAASLVASPVKSSDARTAPLPNILFILADDLGFADLSCYGRTDYQTPVLDMLARDGIKLSAGYANSSVCSPTRVALITGRYQYRLRVGLDEPLPPNLPAIGLPPAHPTLPSLLRRKGFRTSLIGKWHMGETPNFGPLESGYQSFFGIYEGGADYFTHKLYALGKEFGGLYEGRTPIAREGYLTDLLTDRAVAEISSFGKGRAPFLMSLHYTAPHWPWEGPEDRSVDHSNVMFARDSGSLKTYAQMVRSLDASVGRVLAALDSSGLASNTLVVFTSDNGGERYSQQWPFVGAKGELLEGGIRVPLLLRWPGMIRPESQSDQVMISMDFVPTLLAAAGSTPDPRYPSDGENLLPVLTGEAPKRIRTLFWRQKNARQAAVLDGDWKYLKLAGKEHLFNLAFDAHEQANFKDREPKIFKRLKALWHDWNAQMLPYPPESYSAEVGAYVTERYGRVDVSDGLD